MSVPEVPGTTAPPPAVTPASTPALVGGLTTGSVAQTNYLGGTVISTLPPNLQVEKGVLRFRPPARVFG
jgi:hypothetical protein